ncbi:hypothetical protein [Agitococcus lubricus]|uniref:Uncharacterized protein n=1 Tax=Agitococcus lubricus TaxID=1077255 RepID=A0A2T5IZ25_9GAMM|nr:hypothetical protein [Agitococcus lubricus]PTQ89181.1 hypothetical protein C8N29_10862 [Agitococcus lubricus]
MSMRHIYRLALISAAILTTACSPNRFIGNKVVHNTVENVLPEVMKSDDITMVCHSNESFSPLMMSFARAGVDTNMILAFSYSGSSACIERQAAEKEFWSTQAEQQGWTDIAIDARIAQQLLNKEAGVRQVRAYQHAATYFQNQYRYEIGEGKCPAFKNDSEQLLLLVAATASLQALQNDVASGRLVDFDMAIPPKIGRAMSCLDNQKWWGEPLAVQASLRVILPKDAADEAQGWQQLQEATDIGLQTGVRLSHATYAVVAYAKDREDYLRDALKRYEAIPAQALSSQYRLFDEMAGLQIRRIADRLWLKHERRRAPTQNFSKFWDEKVAPSKELNNLLEEM